MAIHNTSDKHMAERECFWCRMKGHTIIDCRKISVETNTELVYLGNFKMSHCLEAVKNMKITLKEGTQYVVQEEVGVQENEKLDANEDA